MQRAAQLHDYAFTHETDTSRLSIEDANLFYRWTLEADSESDSITRCQMYNDICTYWPYARALGRYFWDSPELL